MTDYGHTIGDARKRDRCPECTQGKHPNCTGQALTADDQLVACACGCVQATLERSSLGTPAARAARASVSPDRAAAVVARARDLETRQGGDRS